jgi:tetratricopeptide (TPR) repeat protein
MGKNAEAIDCFSRALTIKEKQTGKDSMDCAQTLNNLGGVYKKMEKFTEALSYYSRSLAIKAKIKGDSM